MEKPSKLNSIADITNLANTRLQEAEVLYNNQLFDGAIYLAGYTIELTLKAKICQLLNIPNLYFGGVRAEILKGFKTHKLEDLLILSGLRDKLQLAKANNQDLFNNWAITCEWDENKRYCNCGTCTQADARKFLDAIKDPNNGIKQWIETN